jgi:tetratricopeptide (TPR) repeat protein
MMSVGNNEFINWILSAGVSSQALVLEAAGAVCQDRGHHEAAIEVLKLSTEIEIDNLSIYQAMARSYMALNRYNDAAMVLEDALANYPDSFEIQSSLLWCYTQPDLYRNTQA